MSYSLILETEAEFRALLKLEATGGMGVEVIMCEHVDYFAIAKKHKIRLPKSLRAKIWEVENEDES